MMRLARTTSLLAALYVLTSAATASAECAWVEWQHTVIGASTRVTTEPVDAYETRQACINAISAELTKAEASNEFREMK